MLHDMLLCPAGFMVSRMLGVALIPAAYVMMHTEMLRDMLHDMLFCHTGFMVSRMLGVAPTIADSHVLCVLQHTLMRYMTCHLICYMTCYCVTQASW
jgi:hypothetical protein